VILGVAFHFWFVNHAEELVERLVSSQSHGKLKLNVKKFKFNWFSRKMELVNATFYSTDTLTAPTAYRFSVDQLRIEVKAILPIVFEKKILIDSLRLINPDITVTRLRAIKKDTTSADDTELSIPQEMGKIYNSIQDALQVLKVSRFQIDNGRFSLLNKIRTDEKPVVISNLFFNVDNLQVSDTNSTNAQQKIFFSDNIALRTHNQDILFPDGRHRLSFKNFRINILNRLVEFDSCTIAASKEDSSNNSFKVFFEKLRLTNIDFDTLYHKEVIKADSVYCFRPRFRLDVQLEKRTGRKAPPKLNELVQQLTGDMQLAFVIVQDGSFDINTMREGRPSSFTSEHNSFEMTGLRIRQNAERPLTVDGFKMGIRNFENFLRDSSYAIQFDSILFNNNRISLSNFSYQELENNRPVNTLIMPQFELQGLSWDNLVLEQQLKAERVSLFRPTIRYHLGRKKNSGNTKDIFKTLAGLGNIMLLNNLNIIEGRINLVFKNNNELQLENTTLSIKGEQLVGSEKIRGIQQSVSQLDFRKGHLKMGDMTADLGDVSFSGTTNQLKAGSLVLRQKDRLQINAKNILIRSLLINDKAESTSIDGISWAKADITLTGTGGQKKSPVSSLLLKNVKGANTTVTAAIGGKKINATLQTIALAEFAPQKDRSFLLRGLATTGTNLRWKDSSLEASVAKFNLADGQASSMQNISFTHYTASDSISLQIPSLSLAPDINAIMNGKIKGGAMILDKPVIKIHLGEKETTTTDETKKTWPHLQLTKLLIRNPDIQFIALSAKGPTSFSWQAGDQESFLELLGILTDENTRKASVKAMRFRLNNFRFADAKGKKFDAGKGRLSGTLRELQLQTGDNETEWQGTVSSLEADNFVLDSLGNKNGRLELKTARLNDLAITSASLLHPRELVKKNTQFRLESITGNYSNDKDQIAWQNAGYDKKTRLFTLDAFDYRPSPTRDSFMAMQQYQKDYMTVSSGPLRMGPVDIDRYISDTVLDIGTLALRDALLVSYRDKRLPFQSGAVRLLPVNLVKSIPIKLTADTILVKDSHIDYVELNEKTNTEGAIAVSQFNARVTHFRNFDIAPGDSLHVIATAKLLDTIRTTLSVKESYTDTLGGFLMTVQMGPADLMVLNPVLVPLASAELKSGQLDTLTMRVVGREYLAFGEMDMRYHDLKVRLLRKGDRERRSFLTGVINLLANTFILKRKNTGKTGTVFFKRLRDRSAVNYLVKITLSGVVSSAGVKKNKKLVKKYKKEIRKRNLPPIEQFPVD